MTGAVIAALVPVVLLIGLGAGLRRSGFLAETFWPQAERLSFYVLLPCLLFHGLATAQLEALPVADLALTLIAATLAVAGLVMAVRPLLRLDGPGFTSVFQGSIRFNNYVGVSLAAGLFGAQGVALAATCNAAIIPTVNTLCVLVFARYGARGPNPRGIGRQLLGNPLLVGSLGGILFQTLGLDLPAGIKPMLGTLGAASLPLGLLCVGAALDFRRAGQWVGPVVSSMVMKFAAMPLVTLAVAQGIGLQGPALTTALLFQVLPTASSAYIMARQLGGDAPLMAGITATQTVLALVTVPLALLGLSAWLPA